jgi:hypothetical protein
MPKIKFKIDFKEDARNWVRIINAKKNKFGNSYGYMIGRIEKDLLKKIKEASSREKAEKVVFDYLKKESDNFVPEMKAVQKMLEFYLQEKGDDLFKLIEKITEKPMYTDTFNATFTLMSSCPYNSKTNWFMVMGQKPTTRQVTNIFHEILHLQFIHYYQDYCKERGLTKQQFEDLKEALTFLLNEPEFDDFFLAPDYSYNNHIELRKKLKNYWRRTKSFEKLIDKGIDLVEEKIKI